MALKNVSAKKRKLLSIYIRWRKNSGRPDDNLTD